ncbi:hypothetical protein LAZ67_22001732 [Cordylochernes scorpioides]|uniref:Uncharacterized protein n=1 Tax=Cordylochernes scorpioides TaxID=51811 RepID=A0ABY6LP73_9ARAC|nr:hypothetical protein LAZ67_22001732 [Cordylochernes scorpioides]
MDPSSIFNEEDRWCYAIKEGREDVSQEVYTCRLKSQACPQQGTTLFFLSRLLSSSILRFVLRLNGYLLDSCCRRTLYKELFMIEQTTHNHIVET